MPGSRSRLTDEQRDQIAALRERGWSYERIGRKFGMSAKAISWHCLMLGAEPPKRWPLGDRGPMTMARGNHTVRRFTPEEDRKLIELERAGKTYSQIGQAIGRRHNSVRGRLATLARREERAAAAPALELAHG